MNIETAPFSVTAIEWFVLLLVVATTVSLLTRHVRLPYTVALVVVGLAVGFSHQFQGPSLSKDIILLVFLPPLLFEGTLSMDLGMLRNNWREVSLLSLAVTGLCFVIVGAVAHLAFGYPWPYAMLLGAILAPTDPVSVLAMMRQTGVSRRLSLLVESESCFNDGIGVVLFLIVTQALDGVSVTATNAFWLFVRETGGGLLIGSVLGYSVHSLLGRMDDHLAETMLSLALAYGAYALAERLHVSGIMAVIAAGLVIGNYGKVLSMSQETRMALTAFWEVMAFMANSMLFLLMGMVLETASLWSFAIRILAAFLVLIVTRQVLIYATALTLRLWRRPLPRGWSHAIGWAGLRGSIPIALALGIPAITTMAGGPNREELLSIVFGVVLLSLLVQGLTIEPLLRRLHLSRRNEQEERFEQLVGQRIALLAALTRLGEMNGSGQVPQHLDQELRTSMQEQIDALQVEISSHLDRHPELAQSRRDEIGRALFLAKRGALAKAVQRGFISEHTHACLLEQFTAEGERATAMEGYIVRNKCDETDGSIPSRGLAP